MNPRQRRGLLLIAVAALGLLVVFVLVAGYVGDVRKEVDPKVSLLALAKPVGDDKAITDDMVKTVDHARALGAADARCATRASSSGWSPAPTSSPTRCSRRTCSRRRRSSRPGSARSRSSSTPRPASRARSARTRSSTSIATYPGGEATAPRESRVVVPGARIIDVGQPRAEGRPRRPGAGRRPAAGRPRHLRAHAAGRRCCVSYAESYATEVRLALLRPGDERGAEEEGARLPAEPDPVADQ